MRGLRLSLNVVLVGAALGCGPMVRLNPHGRTIQQQCGVEEAGVTREQALCIARLGGLESGARPWVVKDETNLRAYKGLWVVCNTMQVPHGSEGPNGKCWEIRRTDGSIVSISEWETVTVE